MSSQLLEGYFPPSLTDPQAAIAARDAYQAELMAQAEAMLAEPVPEDQPWVAVGLTLAAVLLLLHEDEEEGMGIGLFVPTFRRKKRSPKEMLALLEVQIRQYATQQFNWRQEHLIQAAMQRFPYAKKRWTSQRDDRVRDTHEHAHGQVRPLREPFRVGEALLPFPGWPLGPPEEVLGCRCVLTLEL